MLSLGALVHADGNQMAIPQEELRELVQILNKIRSDYVREIDDRALLHHAIDGALRGLDRNSAYLTDQELHDAESPAGSHASVGVEVRSINGLIKIVAPLDDTPAYRAGLRSGEVVVRIDTEPTFGMPLSDFMHRLWGEPGSAVSLTLLDPLLRTMRIVPLTREVISQHSTVSLEILQGSVAYVRISRFADATGSDLRIALQKTIGPVAQAQPKGVILDLRDNPGGLLTAAIASADLLLPPKVLVATALGRAEGASREYRTQPDEFGNLPVLPVSIPLVVLVNAGTAACSEILAAALHDNGRSKIVGTRTYGSANIQTIIPLVDGGAIRLTTSDWHRPNGGSIEGSGVQPDIEASDETALGVAIKLLTGEEFIRQRKQEAGKET